LNKNRNKQKIKGNKKTEKEEENENETKKRKKCENGPGPIPNQSVRCLLGTDLIGVKDLPVLWAMKWGRLGQHESR
jgi:hypothetical protein